MSRRDRIPRPERPNNPFPAYRHVGYIAFHQLTGQFLTCIDDVSHNTHSPVLETWRFVRQ
ncbi:hypothetical protein D910_07579 [Dendroctonus ponderosae]|uniref:Uncharacterized protein n=1 Tax=Dendroctonus ponderosae TaxID=77166 RepID=U4UHY6_DENPD|nr:hypothetical protein D910_07579 [Dendroctonus ponderosae]